MKKLTFFFLFLISPQLILQKSKGYQRKFFPRFRGGGGGGGGGGV